MLSFYLSKQTIYAEEICMNYANFNLNMHEFYLI